jgi:hypothetical protein
MKREVITKQDAARRQLELAIQLYFDNGDLVAIHTLACAAREIFEKHCKLDNRHRLFDQIQKNYAEKSDKELWDVLNRARNFFKHPDPKGDLGTTIELGEADNRMTIFMAAYDCFSLLNEATPPLFLNFITWFVGTQPIYRQHFPELDSKFPELHEASDEAQRIVGKLFVMRATTKWTRWPP